MPTHPNIDAKIAALRTAVGARDGGSVASLLASIEQDLDQMNPLTRGLTYAHVQSVLGRPDEAAAVLEDLLELVPEDGVVHYQLGCYRRTSGNDAAALAAFTRATELDASLVDAWINRGTMLDDRGEPERAVEAYRHAILRAPTEADVWRNLGNSLAAMACFEEAIDAYRTAAAQRPGDETIAFLAASAHQATGDVERANALLSVARREELGEVTQVRLQAHGRDLRCRFHATRAQLDAYTSAAVDLLPAVVDELVARADETAFPLARHEAAFVVRQTSHWLLCDADQVRAGLPNRFFDATRLVRRASEAG